MYIFKDNLEANHSARSRVLLVLTRVNHLVVCCLEHFHHALLQCPYYPPRIVFVGGDGCRFLMASAIIIGDVSWTTIVFVVVSHLVAIHSIVRFQTSTAGAAGSSGQ